MSRLKIRTGVLAGFAILLMPVKAQTAPVEATETLEQRVARLEKLVADLTQQLKAATSPKTEVRPEIAPEAKAALKAEVKAEIAPEVKAEIKADVSEQVAEAARKTPAVTADTSGFNIKSADENFALKIGADLQVDTRSYSGTGSSAFTDGAVLRRVRPTISGTVYKYIDFYFRPDFGLGSTVIYEAYMEFRYWDFAKLRAGKFKPPVGLERLQSDDDTTFVERGLPTLLVPSRDIGYQVAGDVLKNRLYYAVGVFNGVADNSLSDAPVSNHRDYSGRLFLTPFAGGNALVSGLGFGIGTSGGNVDGEPLPAYKTFGQNTFETFNSGVAESGHRTRLSPGGYYYVGAFGLFSEYGVTEEGLQKGAAQHDFAFRAWQVAASVILTGEKKSYLSPTPRHPFDPRNNTWGALELAVRTGGFRADTGLFGYGFIDPAKSPRSAREWIGGGNWYLNRLVRISADYGNTNFEGGATAAAGYNRPAERVLILRFQLNFI